MAVRMPVLHAAWIALLAGAAFFLSVGILILSGKATPAANATGFGAFGRDVQQTTSALAFAVAGLLTFVGLFVLRSWSRRVRAMRQAQAA